MNCSGTVEKSSDFPNCWLKTAWTARSKRDIVQLVSCKPTDFSRWTSRFFRSHVFSRHKTQCYTHSHFVNPHMSYCHFFDEFLTVGQIPTKLYNRGAEGSEHKAIFVQSYTHTLSLHSQSRVFVRSLFFCPHMSASFMAVFSRDIVFVERWLSGSRVLAVHHECTNNENTEKRNG